MNKLLTTAICSVLLLGINATAQAITLTGTELSLRAHAQATPTSELFVISFPASAVVSETTVEFPDVGSLFDPSTGVPPGFSDLVDVAIDAGSDYIEIDFTNSLPFTKFTTSFQNTYVFTFDSSLAISLEDAVIDASVTTLGLTPDRVSFVGNELFVNAQSLPFDTSTFARINLTAESVSVPVSVPVPTPGTIWLFALGLLSFMKFRTIKQNSL